MDVEDCRVTEQNKLNGYDVVCTERTLPSFVLKSSSCDVL